MEHIYATSMDYDLHCPTTKDFFANVQNKLHFAVHGHTAAVVIAKNYLSKDEIKSLNRIVTMYLDYAEDQAEKGIPMTMKDWATKLNAFLQFNDKELFYKVPGANMVYSIPVAKRYHIHGHHRFRIVVC
jgi:hypothetical protein